MRNFHTFCIAAVFALLAATILPATAQTIRRVTMEGTGDGSDWANAMGLQAALAASTMAGDQVWIAAGTYLPHETDRTATFRIPAGVLVYGGFAGNEAALADRMGGATILLGDLADNDIARPAATADQTIYEARRNDNSYTVVTIAGADVTLNGLTITAGEGGTDLDGAGPMTILGGAGLYASATATNALLVDCTFTGNKSEFGGGGAYFDGSATLMGCTFIDNRTKIGDGGGAHFVREATLINCTFTDNCVKIGDGGGVGFSSGGTVINSTFYNNTANNRAGAIFVRFNRPNPFTLQNSILMGNTTTTVGKQVFVNNEETTDVVVVQHNLIAGGVGDAASGAGLVYQNAGSMNIMENNTIDEPDAAVVFVSTMVGGAYFLRLASGSPAVNAGNNDYVNNATPPITIDAAGDARIQGGAVNLGAYESAPRGSIILRVAETATGDESGSTWANAMTLQAALAAETLRGDQIWIAQGIYKPHATDQRATFRIPEGVLVYGGFAGTEDDTFDPVTTARMGAATLLLGDLLDDDIPRPEEGGDMAAYDASRDDNSRTVVTIAGANVVLDGLTIQDGEGGTLVEGVFGDFEYRGGGLYSCFANTSLNACVFTGNSAEEGGGAAFSEPSTLTDCTFTDNSASLGGGALFSEPSTLTGCTFTGNRVGSGFGGGAYFFGKPTLIGCTFTGNRAGFGSGGGAYFFGEPTLTGCTFTGNHAEFGDGGGASFDRQASLTGCTFTGNRASRGAGANFRGQVTLTNCTFTYNGASRGGGVRFSSGGTVINSTFYNNTATRRGGGIVVFFNDLDIAMPGVQAFPFMLQNSILVGNTAMNAASGHQVYTENGDPATEVLIQHNLIAGGVGDAASGAGLVYAASANITETNTVNESDVAVVFASTDVMNANYLRLREFSPAVGAGNNDYLNGGTVDPDDDITTDAVGAARIQTVEVDLGAYESAFATPMQQTLMFTSDAAGTVGNTITLAATASSGLSVTFAITGQTPTTFGTGDVVTLDTGTGVLTLENAGTVVITATQTGGASGSTTYAAVTTMETITVSKQPQTIDFTLANTGNVGDNIALAATATSMLNVFYTLTTVPPTGVATLTNAGDGIGTLTLTGEGTATITATQSGNDTYAAAPDVMRTLTVEAAVSTQSQTIDFTLANTGNVGDNIALAATANSGLDVSFAIEGELLPDGSTATEGAVATLIGTTLTLTGEGTVTITASQSGNDTYAAAPDVMQTLTVGAVVVTQSQTIDFTLANTGDVGDNIALAATANSGLDVSFAIEGELLPDGSTATEGAVATLIGTTLTLTGEGTVTVTATQSGNDTYAAAPDVMRTLTVRAVLVTQSQTIDFTLANTGDVGDNIALTATANSGLDVSFTIEGELLPDGSTATEGAVATLIGTTLTLTGEGTVTVTATQDGNDTYAAAPDVMRTLTVSKQAQAITFSTPANDVTGTVGNTIALRATTDAMGLNASFAISPSTGVATLTDAGDGTGVLTLIGAGRVTVTVTLTSGRWDL